jgi:hypothetical protein
MLAIISLVVAAAIFLLTGLHVLDDSADVTWPWIGMFFFVLGILLWGFFPDPWRRGNPPG